ncbi:MAG: DUF2892 domain-containing protein [Endozoicomonadaceae bacterium]|nr:DUF2892 domain-containing protein [Endozoicomonadaceae bacterium]
MINFIPKNIGRLDQVLRLGLSACMIYAGFVNEELIQDEFSSILLGVIGTVLMYTVIMRSCPLYILIGWNSCRNNPEECDEFDTYSND